MDKLHWTTPQISEIEVKMTEQGGSIVKQGTSVDSYSSLSGVLGSVVNVTINK
jgi:hypothetical protein